MAGTKMKTENIESSYKPIVKCLKIEKKGERKRFF